MTISNGNVPDTSSGTFPGNGGGVYNQNSTLTLNGVTVSGNTAITFTSGGVFNTVGTTTILNSTVSGNFAPNSGAGIFVNDGTVNVANSTVSGNTVTTTDFPEEGGGIGNLGTLNMNNVTVTGNTGSASGTGGVSNGGGTINTRNTIISGNTATGSTSPDVFGTFTSNGNNLIGNATGSTGFSTAAPTLDKIGAPANLGALANNGGQTDTHALLAGSAAIDAGNSCVVTGVCGLNNPPAPLTFDQRGSPASRLLGTAVDIGAFEFGSRAPTAGEVTVSGRAISSNNRGIRNVMIQMTDGNGIIRTVLTSAFGYYRFANVAAGETYILTARGKSYSFSQPTQVVNVGEDETEINFVAYRSDKGR